MPAVPARRARCRGCVSWAPPAGATTPDSSAAAGILPSWRCFAQRPRWSRRRLRQLESLLAERLALLVHAQRSLEHIVSVEAEADAVIARRKAGDRQGDARPLFILEDAQRQTSHHSPEKIDDAEGGVERLPIGRGQRQLELPIQAALERDSDL